MLFCFGALHSTHAIRMFVHVVAPPFERGITRRYRTPVAQEVLPQICQTFLVSSVLGNTAASGGGLVQSDQTPSGLVPAASSSSTTANAPGDRKLATARNARINRS